MPRPRRCRNINGTPGTTYFKPARIPLSELEEVTLELEEFETLRLVDALGNDQLTAAQEMGVSQPTLSRMLAAARQKIATAITRGHAIQIKHTPTTDTGTALPQSNGRMRCKRSGVR
jgi:predicted DNA-binding protein (UPF0251 family)